MGAKVQADLDRVMRQGRRVFAPGLVIYTSPLTRPAKPRIIVGQKVDKRSVVRHKVKRRLRHILQSLVIGNLGVVVVAKKEVLQQSFPELLASIAKAIPKP